MSVLQSPTRSALVAALLAATYLLTHATAPASPVMPPSFTSLPLALPPWSGAIAPPLDPEIAQVLAADEYVRRYYSGPGGAIEMDLSYYTQPRVGTTLHSPLNCLPGTGWEITSVGTRHLTTAAGTWGVRELTVRRGATGYALTYWIQSRDRVIANEVSARLHLLRDALNRRPTDASLVRVMMPASGAAVAERDTLADFATRLIPEVFRRLQ